MDFIRTTLIGADFKDLQPPTQIYADVVLIDSSKPGVIPDVYCLKDNQFVSDGNALSLVGKKRSINHEAKTITIINQRTLDETGSLTIITYNHLIIALPGKTDPQEFSAGLAALLSAGLAALSDAIKLKGEVPGHFSALEEGFKASSPKKRFFGTLKGLPSPTIKEIVNSHITENSVADISGNLADCYERLYEVHVGS